MSLTQRDGPKREPVREPVVITINGPDARVDIRHAGLVASLLKTVRTDWAGSGPLTGRRVHRWHGRPIGTTYTFPAKLAVGLGAHLDGRGIPSTLRGFLPRHPKGWDAARAAVRELLGDPLSATVGGLIPRGRGRNPSD